MLRKWGVDLYWGCSWNLSRETMSFSCGKSFENHRKFSEENFSVSHEKTISRTLEIFLEEKCWDFVEETLVSILEHSLRRFQREYGYIPLERLLKEISWRESYMGKDKQKSVNEISIPKSCYMSYQLQDRARIGSNN